MSQPITTQSNKSEGRTALAIDALKQDHILSVESPAKAYDVPFSTLQCRSHTKHARHDLRPTNCKLTGEFKTFSSEDYV